MRHRTPTVTVEDCTDFAAQAPVSTFTDAKSWYPGIEIRGSSIFYRDADASTVVPSPGNAPYSTRVVDAAGNPLPQYYGLERRCGDACSARATRPTTVSRTTPRCRS